MAVNGIYKYIRGCELRGVSLSSPGGARKGWPERPTSNDSLYIKCTKRGICYGFSWEFSKYFQKGGNCEKNGGIELIIDCFSRPFGAAQETGSYRKTQKY
jgi:hypothetical protein